jgi:hypothetical protein
MRNYVSCGAYLQIYQGGKILQGYKGQGSISRLHEKETQKVKKHGNKTWVS